MTSDNPAALGCRRAKCSFRLLGSATLDLSSAILLANSGWGNCAGRCRETRTSEIADQV